MLGRFDVRPRLTLAALAALPFFAACGPKDVPPSGQGLYVQHCASCHGEKGDGQGPLASSLQRPPADLTRIAERNGGRFDASEIMSIIDGRRSVAAHGPREMPVWGAVFEESVKPGQYPAYTSLLHSRALTEYLQSIQQ